jgi:hypothetical protein
MRRLLVPLALIGGAATAALHGPRDVASLFEREAHAKSGMESAYTWEQTWNTTLRLLRVDLGYKVLEKDEQAGYILFEYTDKGSTSSASIELLKGGSSIRVVCQIPKFPSYHESVVLDRLQRKLKDDHGLPPEKPKPAPDAGPPPSDGGGDGGA